MGSPSSSSSSLVDDEPPSPTGPLFHPVPPPCTNHGILRNGPTSPPTKQSGLPVAGPSVAPPAATSSSATEPLRRRGASIVAKVVSITATPPEHYRDLELELPRHSPPLGEGRLSRSNSLSRAPDHHSYSDDSDNEHVDDIEGIQRRKSDCEKVKFAPLPPGRRQYRSNSLSLGVAARAKMISAQGAPFDPRQARFAGPQQQWYTGGTLPEDVYTIKDVQRGIQNIWSRVKRRRSTSSASSNSNSETSGNQQESREMEIRQKGKTKEIEHIEEVDEHDEDDEEDQIETPKQERSVSGIDGTEEDGSEESERGRSSQRQLMPDNVGLDVPPPTRRESVDSSTTGASSSVGPKTPEDFSHALPDTGDGINRKGKGKGKAVMRESVSTS
ncbi:Golgi apparatus membrane protein tvp23 [Microbotryomycetes sp. JL201]|nr:Golgi apparatus membrane protein tvp23 [Microbotryomycetes sp. JL201]